MSPTHDTVVVAREQTRRQTDDSDWSDGETFVFSGWPELFEAVRRVSQSGATDVTFYYTGYGTLHLRWDDGPKESRIVADSHEVNPRFE